jgi:hypothetical protein
MAESSPLIRKRDKLKQKRSFGQFSSDEAPRSPFIVTLGRGPAPPAPSSSVHLSSAGLNAVGNNAGSAGSNTVSYEVSSTDSVAKSSTREPQNLSIEQVAAPRSSSTDTEAVPTSALAYDTAYSMNTSSPILPPPQTPQPRDLWEDAFQKLSSEDQKAVGKLKISLNTRRNFSETIQELLDLTTKVQDKCQSKSYKFSFKGKEVIMRDVAGKIIFWLNKFKEVGDVAVNFDPVHASLPWAGVRFLLQVCRTSVEGSLLTCAKAAIAEHEQNGYLITAAEKLSCLISRGAIHERLYQPGTISEDVLARFDQALVALYVAMLRMIALCHRLLAKNTATRVVHAIFKPGDICELLDQCEKLEVQVEFEVQNCERARSKETDEESKRLLEILQEPILRTDQNVFHSLEKVKGEEHLKVLDWISNVPYGLNHQTVREERTPETCDWLLRHSRYKEWQDTSASITLWLWGTGELQKLALDSF